MDKKGVIIHLDNEAQVLSRCKGLFEQNELGLDYITCSTRNEFDQALKFHKNQVKGLVFDLLSSDPSALELHENDAEFLGTIEENFAAFNVPIFIFSGFLEAIDRKFENYGTVYKIDKGNDDFQEKVIDKIALLFKSGFIDVFCSDGVLESAIKMELNKSFTRQFTKNSQIEDIINSIDPKEGQGYRDRTTNIFKRVTIKALSSELLSPVIDSEEKVHPIEHFYIRQSKLKVWTGDVWFNKTENYKVVVLTPRCDLAIGKASNIIFCRLDPPPTFDLNARPDKLIKLLNNHLIDNIEGKAKRYIPSNVFIPEGGMINLSTHETLPIETFLNDYEYIVTLSDDLTNEIIGKFAYYFLRTGINNINEKEFEAIIKQIKGEAAND